jgi:hypothetical protein
VAQAPVFIVLDLWRKPQTQWISLGDFLAKMGCLDFSFWLQIWRKLPPIFLPVAKGISPNSPNLAHKPTKKTCLAVKPQPTKLHAFAWHRLHSWFCLQWL